MKWNIDMEILTVIMYIDCRKLKIKENQKKIFAKTFLIKIL